jgi:FkbM family methyltransferase
MATKLRSLISNVLGASPLQFWPVTVRAGLAKGARWTAFPYSSNWRTGGEPDLATCVSRAGDLRGASCWDLGAHFGIHTIGLARSVGPSGAVVGFEPDPVAFKKLTYHVGLNRLHCVKLYQAAASDVEGPLELIITGGLGSSVTHARGKDETLAADAASFVGRAVRLDALVERGEIRAPDLIKVDVEGHGAKALAGAINAIAKSQPVIVFSLHGMTEWLGTASQLKPLRYRCHDVASDREIGWDAYPGFGTVVFRCRR